MRIFYFFSTKFQCTIPILAMYVLDIWAQNLAKVNSLTVSVTVFSWCSIESSSQFRKIDYTSNRPTYFKNAEEAQLLQVSNYFKRKQSLPVLLFTMIS